MEEKENRNENTVSCEELRFLFIRSSRLMHRGRHYCGRMHPAQGHVLSILDEREMMTQKELMSRLGVRSGSLSELLAKLERHGCIIRLRDEQDKRGFVVMLTEKGRTIASEHEMHRREQADSFFSPLSEDERRQLGNILEKLSAAWEDAPQAGQGVEAHGDGRHCRLGNNEGRRHCRRHGPGRGVMDGDMDREQTEV